MGFGKRDLGDKVYEKLLSGSKRNETISRGILDGIKNEGLNYLLEVLEKEKIDFQGTRPEKPKIKTFGRTEYVESMRTYLGLKNGSFGNSTVNFFEAVANYLEDKVALG